MRSWSLGRGLAVALGFSSHLAAQTVNVRLWVKDQHGNDIVGSQLKSESIPWTTSGGSVSMLPGTHQFTIVPVLLPGRRLDLGRSEVVTITAATTEVTFTWITAQVRLGLRNQHSVDLPNSWVTVVAADVHSYPAGTTVALPITDPSVYPTIWSGWTNGYRFAITPGLIGTDQYFELVREEYRHVTAATTDLTFEWETRSVVLRVEDQHGVAIPNSWIAFDATRPRSIGFRNGSTVELPITDNAFYPSISSGLEAGGYNVVISPGLPGTDREFHDLGREVDGNEVTPLTDEFRFEWRTSTVLLRVQDQAGVEIPGSWITLDSTRPRNISFPTGSVVALPVTDAAVYPTVLGADAPGFPMLFTPGVQWSHRQPTTADGLVRMQRRIVGIGTTSMTAEWHVVDCAIALRLAGGPEVPGSLFFDSPHSTQAAGSVVRLPITENAVYPDLAGTGANGYTVVVGPAALAPVTGTFQFEVLQSGAFEPATFAIGGNTYSLFCRTNTPPVADAGPNRSITTSQIGTTTIAGAATDADNQGLTYRWLREATLLHGPAPVGAGGTAPLPLAMAPALGIGSHELLLAVTDGVDTATARMVLTIGNSPPTPACTGSGTYRAGTDSVTLGGTVSDFDGDPVQWSWWNGSSVLASGWITPAAGGLPATLPTVALTTGAAGQLGLGNHALQLRVDDTHSGVVPCDASVVVIDDEAPRLAPVADRSILWPPNHAMVPITIVANAVDAAGGPVLLSATVQSSEDAYKDGAGNTVPDYSEPSIDQASGRIQLYLRAERSGKGPGRTYTVTVTATDSAGNRSIAALVITAPHDRG